MAKEGKKGFVPEGETWDDSVTKRVLSSEKRAWVLFWLMFLIAALSVGAVAALAPLKSVETFVVRVDNATGIVDVIHGEGESGGESNYNEAIDKHFVARYLRHRENYSAGEFKENYKIIGLMSSGDEGQRYYSDVYENPSATHVNLNDNDILKTKIKNISFIDTASDRSIVTVRFLSWVDRGSTRSDREHWVSTIEFHYIGTPEKESDRLLNPLGFEVVSYRKDPEVVN